MVPVEDMCRSDMEKLLIEFYDYSRRDARNMTIDELEESVQTIMDDFESSELKDKIDQSCLIDLNDDDLTLLDILKEWEDVNDDSDMYPNGRDDE